MYEEKFEIFGHIVYEEAESSHMTLHHIYSFFHFFCIKPTKRSEILYADFTEIISVFLRHTS